MADSFFGNVIEFLIGLIVIPFILSLVLQIGLGLAGLGSYFRYIELGTTLLLIIILFFVRKVIAIGLLSRILLGFVLAIVLVAIGITA